MFTYLPEKKRFTIRLGQFISHSIVKPNSRLGYKDHLQSPSALNTMNRYELAQSAYEDMPSDLLAGEYSKEQLLHELAVYIDRRIPQSYVKWKEREHDKGPAGMKIKAEDYGFIYHFDKEGNPMSEISDKTSLKQTKKQADDMLQQFTQDMEKAKNKRTSRTGTNKRAEGTTKPKQKRAPSSKSAQQLSKLSTSDTTVNTPLIESNYTRLNTYLRENELSLEKELYKSVLFAMNGMTTYHQTKASAIKKSSQLHGVTQKAIKEHIDAMGIVSERASQSGYKPKGVSGKEASLQHAFKRRIEREETD